MGETVLDNILIVAVHVTSNCFNTVHPLISDEVYEVIKRFFLLAIGKPQYVPRLQIHYNRHIFVVSVQEEFVYAKVFACLSGFLRCLPSVVYFSSSRSLSISLMVFFPVGDHLFLPKGTADKILDFFLRRKRVLAKYTKDEYGKVRLLMISCTSLTGTSTGSGMKE